MAAKLTYGFIIGQTQRNVDVLNQAIMSEIDTTVAYVHVINICSVLCHACNYCINVTQCTTTDYSSICLLVHAMRGGWRLWWYPSGRGELGNGGLRLRLLWLLWAELFIYSRGGVGVCSIVYCLHVWPWFRHTGTWTAHTGEGGRKWDETLQLEDKSNYQPYREQDHFSIKGRR